MVTDATPDGAPRPADVPPAPVPRSAAGLLGTGIALLVIGWPLLAAAGYQSWWYDTHLRGMSYPEPTNSGTLLFWVAMLVLIAAAVTTGLGVHRLVERADRRAGVVRLRSDQRERPPIPQ